MRGIYTLIFKLRDEYFYDKAYDPEKSYVMQFKSGSADEAHWDGIVRMGKRFDLDSSDVQEVFYTYAVMKGRPQIDYMYNYEKI